MPATDVENRLAALEHFVVRLYNLDCLESGNPVERLGRHRKFAEAVTEHHTLRGLKGSDDEMADGIVINDYVMQFIDEVERVVQASVK